MAVAGTVGRAAIAPFAQVAVEGCPSLTELAVWSLFDFQFRSAAFWGLNNTAGLSQTGCRMCVNQSLVCCQKGQSGCANAAVPDQSIKALQKLLAHVISTWACNSH